MSYFDDVIEPRIIRGSYYTGYNKPKEKKMSNYEMKDLTGNCFKNKNKIKDTQADFTGEMKIDGTVYWLNTWEKRDKNGNIYFSHSLKKKEFKEAKKAAMSEGEMDDMMHAHANYVTRQASKPGNPNEFEDEIPF